MQIVNPVLKDRSGDKSYLLIFALVAECHKDHWDEEIEHHKHHEYNTRTKE